MPEEMLVVPESEALEPVKKNAFTQFLAAMLENVTDPLLRARCANAERFAEEFEIKTVDDYNEAFEMRQRLMTDKRTVLGLQTPLVTLFHATHKAAVAYRDSFVGPLDRADNTYEKKRLAFSKEQDRIDQERQRKAREEAQKQQQDQAEQMARELEEQAEPEAAEIVRTEARRAPAPSIQVQSSVPKQSGAVKKKVYHAEVTNVEILPEKYWTRIINQAAIDGELKLLEDKLIIPGVRVWFEEKEDVRRSRR